MASIDHSFKRGDDQLPYKKGVTQRNIEKLAVLSSRLRIRPITIEDAENVFRAFTPKVAEFMTPAPAKDVDETITFLASAIEARHKGSDLQLVITDKQSGEFLGLIGFHTRYGASSPELGVWLKESAWGKGYGSEAVHQMIAWANDNMEFTHIVYPVAEANVKSRAIAESYGAIVVSSKTTSRTWAPDLVLVEYHIPAGTTPKLPESPLA